jgi:C-terminal processing protease CtpA/Prc
LYDGSSLHLTVVKWLLPDGSWINAENVIVPDSEVELSDEDFKVGKDPQLEKAIEILKK